MSAHSHLGIVTLVQTPKFILGRIGLRHIPRHKEKRTTRLSGPYPRFAKCFWSGREDSNLRPLGPEPLVRQKRKLLPFQKLQPPQIS
jgi:hypothetical protein